MVIKLNDCTIKVVPVRKATRPKTRELWDLQMKTEVKGVSERVLYKLIPLKVLQQLYFRNM